jgi:hypothetical protein
MLSKLFVSVCLLFCFTSKAQVPKDITIQDFLADVGIAKTMDSNLIQAIWVPDQFWDITQTLNSDVTPAEIKGLKDLLNGYTLIGVAEAITNVKEGAPSKSSKDMIVTLTSKSGKVFLPINKDTLSPMLKEVLSALEQGIGNYTGSDNNEEFHTLYVFKTDGAVSSNAQQSDSFAFTVSKTPFVFTSPLSSLLPSKSCPIDKERMKDNWNYCPIHSTKLN